MEFAGSLRRMGKEVGVYFVEGEYDPKLCGYPVDVWIEIDGNKTHLPHHILKRQAFGGYMWKNMSNSVMFNSLQLCVDDVLPANIAYYL